MDPIGGVRKGIFGDSENGVSKFLGFGLCRRGGSIMPCRKIGRNNRGRNITRRSDYSSNRCPPKTLPF